MILTEYSGKIQLILIAECSGYFLEALFSAIIVLDINNIMCYITIPKHGEWYDENNTRHQKYFSKAQRTAAKRSL